MKLSRALPLALALTLTLTAAPLQADDVTIDAFSPAPDHSGFVGFPGSRTPGHLRLDASAVFGYALHPLSADALARGDRMAIRHRTDGTAIVQLGLGSRTALALRMPVLIAQTGDESPARPELVLGAAGNPALDGRVRLWGETARADGSIADGGGIALRGLLHAPIGGDPSYFRDSALRHELQLISDVQLLGIAAGFALSHQHRYAGDEPAFTTLRDRLKVQGGVRMPVPWLSRVFPGRVQDTVLLEIEAATELRDAFARRKTPVEGRLGYRIAAHDLSATASAGAGLIDAIGSPDFRAVLSLGYSPRTRDQDGDGVPDNRDTCVHLPEDRDGFQDDDGCADDDNDGDMVLDDDDRCPLLPAELGQDDDEDGCTDK